MRWGLPTAPWAFGCQVCSEEVAKGTFDDVRDTYLTADGAARVRAWCDDALLRWRTPHSILSLDTCLGATAVIETGDGPDLCVYLPGANYNTATSLPLVDALAARFRVWSVDLPGQPGLSAPGRPNHLEDHAPWLREVLAAARAAHPSARIALVGLSRGAAVALLAPVDAADALVLVSPGGLTKARTGLWAPVFGLRWLIARSPAASRALLARMATADRTPSAVEVDWMTLVARNCRPTLAPDPLPDSVLAGWRGRHVAVVLGSDDIFFPTETMRHAALGRLGVEPVVVPGTGHLLFAEDPVAVAYEVGSLVDSLPASAE